MKKIVRKLSYDPTVYKGEINDEPSMTIPDQSMTVPEMIKRSQRGLPVPGARQPIYTGSTPTPDFDRMDIIELRDFREHNERIIREYNEAVKKRDAEMSQKKVEYEIRKKLEKEEKDRARQMRNNASQFDERSADQG